MASFQMKMHFISLLLFLCIWFFLIFFFISQPKELCFISLHLSTSSQEIKTQHALPWFNQFSTDYRQVPTWSNSCKASSGAMRKPPFPKPSRWDKTAQLQSHRKTPMNIQEAKEIQQKLVRCNSSSKPYSNQSSVGFNVIQLTFKIPKCIWPTQLKVDKQCWNIQWNTNYKQHTFQIHFSSC